MVSVIIPVYKVEKYLARCVDSVLAQTYKDIEIILVDDGSPDNCGKICDEYCRTDSRIRVIHKENGGLSDARNRGVEQASGEYIAFIDSDDYIAPEYIQRLYYLIEAHNADMACACHYQTDKSIIEVVRNKKLPELRVLNGKQACNELFGDSEFYNMIIVACGKLIKSDIVKRHPFPVGKKHEDEATTPKFLYDSNEIVITNEALYAYFQNSDSITHTNGDKKNEDVIWALLHKAEFFDFKNEKQLAMHAYSSLFGYLARDSVLYDGRCDNEIKTLLKGKKLTLSSEIYRLIYACSPKLYKKLQRL